MSKRLMFNDFKGKTFRSHYYNYYAPQNQQYVSFSFVIQRNSLESYFFTSKKQVKIFGN